MFSHAHHPKSRPEWRLPLTFLPAAAVALLPKCPLCLMGIMSAFGLGTVVSVVWLKPLTLMFLGTAVVSLAIRARWSGVYGPLLLGLVATAIVFVSKFYLDYPPADYGGLALLLAATLWGAFARRQAVPDSRDCSC